MLVANLPPVGDVEAGAVGAPAEGVIGGPDRRTQMASSWSDPTPSSGVVEVKATQINTGVQLEATFSAAAPAAIFQRNGVTWAVFGANADLKIDPASLPAGYRVRTLRGASAAILRIEAPKGLDLSAASTGASWRITLASTAERPMRFLKPERRRGDDGRMRIETMLIGAAGLVWFEDPAVGDQIAAAVAYGPSSASMTPLDWVEASLPATAHGLAVIPRSDGAVVTLEGERVVVSMTAAPMSESANEDDNGLGAAVANAAFVDFTAWGATSGEAYFARRDELERKAASLEPSTPRGAAALMDLARFFAGHGMGFETIGVLKLAALARPDLEEDPVWLGLHGAALVMAHRLKEADDMLGKGPLRGDASAALWRALSAAEREQWERANDLFHDAGDQAYAYPDAWGARFMVAQAEAAFFTNDLNTARKLATQAAQGGAGEIADRAKLVLARIAGAVDGPKAAYPMFERLARDAVEPVAVSAELKRLELAVPLGKMTAIDVAQQLESLRFRWRGDGVEMATVGILADQYMQMGRFREALMLAQAAAMRDRDAPGARDLRIRLTDYFRRLYLDGEADRLDPIQALALFYEFSSLTPVGADGDQMIRKLAQRLVAFDLLDPAAELLQHQVDNRMRGVSKAAIAVDLASIYLMNKRPERALAVLASSRQPSLPKDLAIERRLLEAAAYRDLGRFDHTIELVEPLDGRDAKSLLADAYWRQRQWSDAARSYADLLAPPAQAKPGDSDTALRAAIAARMAKDGALLAALRAYLPIFQGRPDQASFDLITSKVDSEGLALSEAARRLGDAPRVDAFAAAMKQRFNSARAIPTDAAAPAQPAAPTQSAAPATAPAAPGKSAQANQPPAGGQR